MICKLCGYDKTEMEFPSHGVGQLRRKTCKVCWNVLIRKKYLLNECYRKGVRRSYSQYSHSDKGQITKKAGHKRYSKTKHYKEYKKWYASSVGKHLVSYHTRRVRWLKTSPGKSYIRRKEARRRQLLGFIALNNWFPGSHGHHVNWEYVIYIPKELHCSVWHSVLRNTNMDTINKEAYKFLFKGVCDG